MKKRLLIILALGCFIMSQTYSQVLPSFGNSRTGTAGLQFLKIAPDARSASLSGSYTALCDDVSAVFWNPAALTQLDSNRYHFQFGHTSYFAGVEMNYAGLAWSKSRLNYWAFSVINLTSGEMPMTTEYQPLGNGLSFSASNLLMALSFAKVLSDNFSFGISGKYVYEDIAGIKMHNGIFDLGFVYNIGIVRTTKFAVGISNFGFNVSPNGEVTLTTQNGEETISNFESVSVPSIFKMGIASNVYEKNNHALTLTAQLTHPTDNNERIGFGVEYSLKRLLYLRSGYEFGADQNGWPSAGIGIYLQRYFGNLKFDYSFNNKDLLGSIHRLTVGFSLK
ncbi:MAG: PorV/PorQ family protein [Bacteroidetes bacterium]|nr:PorV/PorQ family protein [Bacteroidota bacterium]MBT3800968.1 PorV/PorQ family protein [Bacteroidota bacterium]MBT4968288.1 PorV/PorQ family protein [Bacteroidota bacterium]MBT5991685.1 PorV/PorQ family protein [Bacteroidota bacterium]MBT6836613.1 PorV/PorQ family protein [Bacteroidota bacterium]